MNKETSQAFELAQNIDYLCQEGVVFDNLDIRELEMTISILTGVVGDLKRRRRFQKTYKYNQGEKRWYYMERNGKYINYYKQGTEAENTEEGKENGYYNSTNKTEFSKF